MLSRVLRCWAMILRQPNPKYPRQGPSCLLVLFLIFGAYIAWVAFQNREQVLDAVLPDPTATPTQSPVSYATRARLFERDGDYDSAVEAWESAIDLDPSNVTYYVSLIDLMVQVRRTEKAVEIVERVLELADDDDAVQTRAATAYLAYGDYLNSIGQDGGPYYARAAVSAEAATKLNGQNGEAYGLLAGAMVAQDTDLVYEAEEFALAGESLEPENPVVLYHYANIKTIQGYYDIARDLLESVLALDPDNIDAYLDLSRIYYFAFNDSFSALNYLDLALDIDPTNANLYDTRAFFRLQAGDYPSAERDAQKAVEYDASMVRAHAHLGHAYFKNSKYPSAIEELTLAADLYGQPNAQSALYFALLGQAYYYQDQSNCREFAQPLFDEVMLVSDENSPAQLTALEGIEFCRQALINQ